MKLNRTLMLVALASCLFPFAVSANDIEAGKEYYSAIKARNPIVLDGSLPEWTGAAVLADPRFWVPKAQPRASQSLVFFEVYDAGGPGTAIYTGPDDQTSAVQIVYDDDNVYFGFVVTDEYHENAASSPWNGDSVQLMIANEARDLQIALYNYSLGGTEDALGNVIVEHEAGPGGTEAVVTRNTVTKRTIYEIKLPKASLALDTLGAGTRFGMGMCINDGDLAAPGQQGWGGLGVHSIVHGKTPGETALVTLARFNDIEAGKEIYTANAAPKPVVLDGVLSEWTGLPVLSDPRTWFPKGTAGLPTSSLITFEIYDAGGPGPADWTGPDDQTSAVQISYDQDNVYLGVVVTDEYHENAANSPWNGDSVQIMIANANQDQQIALYNYALGGTEAALGNVIVEHEAGPGGTDALVARNTATKRTTYEIKLPKESLGLQQLPLGTQFGLGMAINDGDQNSPGQQGWGGLGAHSIVHGKTPQQTALVTLGVGGTGADTIFLSAISATVNGFSFRVTDKGASIVAPASAKLLIDGVAVALTASPKNLDATDFSYTRPTSFASNSEHTYAIEIKDTLGHLVADASTFKTVYYAILTQAMQATSVDTTKRGFIWKVFQNEAYLHNTLAETELALVGQLVDAGGTPVTDNNADPDATGPALGPGVKEGPLYRFDIDTVINLSQVGGQANGNFPDDAQMPGIPGILTGSNDGIDAEIITFVELPAGWLTLGVNSDDGFRSQAGFINVPADRVLLGEFNGARGAADTLMMVFVQDAGIYPIRTIWQEGGTGANIEIFSVKTDGTKILLNDTDNGGLKSYRVGVAPSKAGPAAGFTIAIVGNDVEIRWTLAGLILQQSTNLVNWGDIVPNPTSPYRITAAAGKPPTFYRAKR